MTKKIAFIARTPSKRKKAKRFTARIVLVYCPRCKMLFYDEWKEPDFWRDLKGFLYLCPYCHAELDTELGVVPSHD